MSDLQLSLTAAISDHRLAQLTRDLTRDLSRNRVSAASVERESKPGEKGDAAFLGQIALGLVSSGAVTALIECFKAYLSRERTLEIRVKDKDNLKIEISSRNIDSAAVRATLEAVVAARK